MIHPTYLPFTPEELAPHFTGDAEANVDYFVRSARRWLAFQEDDAPRPRALSAARSARQMEKDERFWTAAALKSLFDRPDRTTRMARLLERTYGPLPPLSAFDSWAECLEGDDLSLYFEAQLPSPASYVGWLREHLADRHMIPYVLDAGAASSRRLEGATHVDALLLNRANGFSVLIEAKVLSDISPSVSFDTYRNQLIRNIDVMLESAPGQQAPLNRRDPERSLFALLTPEGYRERPHSRLYGWLMGEYRDDPEALARDLPHRPRNDWAAVSRRLGWMTFQDVEGVAPGACGWLRTETERVRGLAAESTEKSRRAARRVALVSCVKSKHTTARPAGDLYTSALFTGMRAYAERHADEWYVLSAKYGLLDPDEVIEPYELTLNRMPAADRAAWAERVTEQLSRMLPQDAEVVVLAGERYRAGVVPFLLKRGHKVSVPMEGLPFGRQLQFLGQANTAAAGHDLDRSTVRADLARSDSDGASAHSDKEVAVRFHSPEGRTLSRLTSRAAVLDAIAEYDSLGSDAFLDKYGYGPARRFFLEHEGRQYDSKAIVGVAFGRQHPAQGHLRSDEFSGGVATVQRKLEELGFKVVVLPAPK